MVFLLLIQILPFPEETRMKMGRVFSDTPGIWNKIYSPSHLNLVPVNVALASVAEKASEMKLQLRSKRKNRAMSGNI